MHEQHSELDNLSILVLAFSYLFITHIPQLRIPKYKFILILKYKKIVVSLPSLLPDLIVAGGSICLFSILTIVDRNKFSLLDFFTRNHRQQ